MLAIYLSSINLPIYLSPINLSIINLSPFNILFLRACIMSDEKLTVILTFVYLYICLFSISALKNLRILPTMNKGFNFSTFLLKFIIFYLFLQKKINVSLSRGCEVYWIVVLIGISWLTNDAKHLFPSLWPNFYQLGYINYPKAWKKRGRYTIYFMKLY